MNLPPLLYLKKIKRLNLPREIISFAIKRHAEKIAFPELGICYQDLYHNSLKLANALNSLGIKKGDCVAFYAQNCHQYFEARIATYSAGMIFLPIIWDMEYSELVNILKDCNVKAFIFQEDLLADRLDFLKEGKFVELFIPLSSEKKKGCYDDLIEKAKPWEPKVPLALEDIAGINLSSATTGSPKRILTMQKNWSASFYNILANSDLKFKNIRVLHVIPFATAGSTTIIPSLMAGVENILLDKFDPEKAIYLIEKFRINTLFLTPGWLIELMSYGKKCRQKLFSLERIIIGTERVPTAKLKEAIDFFGPIIEEGYGMAEALPPISLLKPRHYYRRGKVNEKVLRSLGKIIKDVEVKIAEHDNGIGRIAIRSATVTKGYLNNDALNERYFRDGFYYSDDYGYIEDGFLYLVARKEELIEENPMLIKKIEEKLNENPDISEAVVLKINGLLTAFISLSDRAKKEHLELEEDIKYKLSIVYVDNIPKLACGKINRKELTKIALTSLNKNG